MISRETEARWGLNTFRTQIAILKKGDVPRQVLVLQGSEVIRVTLDTDNWHEVIKQEVVLCDEDEDWLIFIRALRQLDASLAELKLATKAPVVPSYRQL